MKEYIYQVDGDKVRKTKEELIRCKDCRWRYDPRCLMYKEITAHYGYCHKGERKSEVK